MENKAGEPSSPAIQDTDKSRQYTITNAFHPSSAQRASVGMRLYPIGLYPIHFVRTIGLQIKQNHQGPVRLVILLTTTKNPTQPMYPTIINQPRTHRGSNSPPFFPRRKRRGKPKQRLSPTNPGRPLIPPSCEKEKEKEPPLVAISTIRTLASPFPHDTPCLDSYAQKCAFQSNGKVAGRKEGTGGVVKCAKAGGRGFVRMHTHMCNVEKGDGKTASWYVHTHTEDPPHQKTRRTEPLLLACFGL